MIPSPRSHFTSPIKHSLLETHGDELAPSKLGPACSELRNEAQGVVGMSVKRLTLYTGRKYLLQSAGLAVRATALN